MTRSLFNGGIVFNLKPALVAWRSGHSFRLSLVSLPLDVFGMNAGDCTHPEHFVNLLPFIIESKEELP
jgi:hypothetical protein